ncbi:MAG TPA: hypothetical protein ACQGQH_06125 [Xylella sp.]
MIVLVLVLVRSLQTWSHFLRMISLTGLFISRPFAVVGLEQMFWPLSSMAFDEG